MRVAVGAACKLLLKAFHIEIAAHVIQIGNAVLPEMDIAVEDNSPGFQGFACRCVCKKTERP